MPRMNGGRRRPIHLQRMEADDLLAAVWPGLAACQENAPAGPVGVPDHVLARQTVDDCLHEGLSVEGLVDVWSRIESGAIEVHSVESSEPSVFSHAILSGRPYTYLDDAPLEERRTRALSLRRGLGELGADGLPVPADELAALDPDAVSAVLDQVRPRPRDRDELHDLLLSLVAARPVRGMGAAGSTPWWPRDGPGVVEGCWVATERREAAVALADDDEAAAACVGGHLQLAGPVTVDQLVSDGPLAGGAPRGAPLSAARARTGLARLEQLGSAIELPDGRWCARNLLVRLHRASRARRRGLVEAVPIADFVRFLVRWQHVTPDSSAPGPDRPAPGARAAAGDRGARRRVGGADPPGPRRGLRRALVGRAVPVGRGGVGPADPAGRPPGPQRRARRRPRRSPSSCARTSRPCCARCAPAPRRPSRRSARRPTCWPRSGPRGACFRPELAPLTGRLPAEVDEGLWDLVARGLVTADAFSAVRSLLSARDRWRTRTLRRPSNRLAPPACPGRDGHRGRPVVASARTRGSRPRDAGLRFARLVHARSGQRGAGRGRGPPAPGALGCGGVGAVGARVLQGALARGRVGAPPDGGPRRRARRALRRRAWPASSTRCPRRWTTSAPCTAGRAEGKRSWWPAPTR